MRFAIRRAWFADAIPPDWVEVGTWKVPDKIVVADRTVTFFATRAADAETLAQALRAFQPQLPAAVVVRVAEPLAP